MASVQNSPRKPVVSRGKWGAYRVEMAGQPELKLGMARMFETRDFRTANK